MTAAARSAPEAGAAHLRVRAAGRDLLFRQADVLAVALIAPADRARWTNQAMPSIRFADQDCPLFALADDLTPGTAPDETANFALVFAAGAGRIALAVDTVRFHRLDGAATVFELPPAMLGAYAPLTAAAVVGDELLFLASAPALLARLERAVGDAA